MALSMRWQVHGEYIDSSVTGARQRWFNGARKNTTERFNSSLRPSQTNTNKSSKWQDFSAAVETTMEEEVVVSSEDC